MALTGSFINHPSRFGRTIQRCLHTKFLGAIDRWWRPAYNVFENLRYYYDYFHQARRNQGFLMRSGVIVSTQLNFTLSVFILFMNVFVVAIMLHCVLLIF